MAPNRPSLSILCLAKRLQPGQAAQNVLVPDSAFPGIFWDPGICLNETKYRVSCVGNLISGSRHAIRAV
jgi:hypothetical protein